MLLVKLKRYVLKQTNFPQKKAVFAKLMLRQKTTFVTVYI